MDDKIKFSNLLSKEKEDILPINILKESLNNEIIDIPLNLCICKTQVNFPIHRGDLKEFVKSVASFGIISPIIARPVDNQYEVIIGRRRYFAALELHLPFIPAIVKKITDKEVQLIIAETNLHQSSLEDLKYSEIAELVYHYHVALKAQGKRSDLIEDILSITQMEDYGSTSCPVGQKYDSRKIVGSKFSISPRAVSRFLRIYHLNYKLKELLDEKKISLRACVELSYIEKNMQNYIAEKIVKEKVVLSNKHATFIRFQDRNLLLNENTINKIINSHKQISRKNKIGFQPMYGIYEKFGFNRYTDDEIEIIIYNALTMYFEVTNERSNKISL